MSFSSGTYKHGLTSLFDSWCWLVILRNLMDDRISGFAFVTFLLWTSLLYVVIFANEYKICFVRRSMHVCYKCQNQCQPLVCLFGHRILQYTNLRSSRLNRFNLEHPCEWQYTHVVIFYIDPSIFMLMRLIFPADSITLLRVLSCLAERCRNMIFDVFCFW